MISIIILSYRNPALLRLCLRSLQRALAPDTDAEVIVVDSASMPETANVVRHEFADTFRSIRLIPFKENTGYTRGVNAGIRAARGEFILPLNYDIIMEPGTVETLAAHLRAHPNVGLVGPRLLNFDDSVQDSAFRFSTPPVILARRLPLPFTKRLLNRFALRDQTLSGPTEVDWIFGAAFMTTRTAIERVGILDETLFHYFSDLDWAQRFWKSGYSVVYYPMAVAYHTWGRTSKGRFGIFDVFLNKATRWHIADAIRYFRMHGTDGKRPHAEKPLQSQLIA